MAEERKGADEERTYTEDELREDSQGLLGVSSHVVAGALHGASRKTHTLTQAQKAVEGFLKRKVGRQEE